MSGNAYAEGSNIIVKCPRGEICRHKGLKSRGIHRRVSPY